MTNPKRLALDERQRKKREKRRYPFNGSTKLIELVDKKHYGDVLKLVDRLRPYLMDGERGAFMLTRLYFDLNKLCNQRQVVYAEFALFLDKMKREDGLICSQAVFFRYLSCEEHCNLGLSENSLKALILKALQFVY